MIRSTNSRAVGGLHKSNDQSDPNKYYGPVGAQTEYYYYDTTKRAQSTGQNNGFTITGLPNYDMTTAEELQKLAGLTTTNENSPEKLKFHGVVNASSALSSQPPP